MMYPSDRYYTREHEWVLLEGNGLALMGITEYAQDHLGDVVFVDLAAPDTQLSQFEKLGEIESVKAVSDIYSPISGQIAEINQEVVARPELVNEDPHGKGWMVRLTSVDPAQLEHLLSAEAYESFLSQLE